MRLHPHRIWLACAAAWLLAAGPQATFAADAATIAAQGNGKGAAPCQSCHGVDGGGQAAGGFPRLAGLDATYLRRQLDAFVEGTRDNPVMKVMASALTEAERQAMAGYYARLPVPATPASPAKAPPADSPAAQLALRGRWSRQVPACEQCHGPGGIGVGENFPPLAGQPAGYLVAQLKAFRQGTRHNDPLGLMQHLSKALDDADFQGVSDWFAAQPLQRGEPTR
jgi:cytochrome c553